MRAPTHVPTPTRRGLQHVFQRTAPLVSTPPKSISQQAQGLKIATTPVNSSSTTVGNAAVGKNLVRSIVNTTGSNESMAGSDRLFARAWAQLRATFATIWPGTSATVVAAAAVASVQPMGVATCEPFHVEDASDAVNALLSEVSHSEQPLIFSAHNIESYLASRKSEPSEVVCCVFYYSFGVSVSMGVVIVVVVGFVVGRNKRK